MGGQEKIRPLWRHYYAVTDAIIWVVDSNDTDRLDTGDNSAAAELSRLMAEEELRDTLLLVLANKQDLPHAVSVAEITERLRLRDLRSRQWHIQGCCAKTGEGLYEGFDWLAKSITSSSKK